MKLTNTLLRFRSDAPFRAATVRERWGHLLPRLILATFAASACLVAQAPSKIIDPNDPKNNQPQQTPVPPPAAPATPAPATQPQAGPPVARLSDNGGFLMDNVSLTEMVDILAKRLKISFILDPRIRGSVTIHTYGEVKPMDLMPLLQTILRVNGATMVQVGDLYHVVPINTISNLPIDPVTNADPKTLPEDERMILNMVFLKYTTAAEMDKLLAPFMGEGATHSIYEPANLLLIEDNSRSMKRLMNLLAMFDSDTFAGQRVKLFEVVNSRPSDLVRDLENVFKAYALSDKAGSVRFLPIDRIGTLIAIAPNPGVFELVKTWIDKFDIPVKLNAGSTTVWTYKMKYGKAEIVSMAVMALYTGNAQALMALAATQNSSMYSRGIGNNGTGYGAGGYGGGGMGPGAYGGMGQGAYGGGAYGMGQGAYGGGAYPMYQNPAAGVNGGMAPVPNGSGIAASNVVSPDMTGSYMGYNNAAGGQTGGGKMPSVIPNPFDNTVLVRGTSEEIEQIKLLVTQLDVAPRQVLIEAKIYEVDLDNEFADGVESFLQKRGSGAATGVTGNSGGSSGIGGLTPSSVLTAATGAGGLALTVGALVFKSHELLGLLSATETRGRSRVISAPSIIATDSIPATMNVGSQVPVLSSQGLAGGVQAGGSSLFTNTIANQTSGVTLDIVARVNSSGIVTMVIDQQVSAPVAPSPSAAIQSPSFSNRSVSTQVTVQDGDTIAIGGIITENHTESSGGVPFLHRIPIIGAAFGAKSVSTQRTELIIFLTPRVIYDTNQIVDATEEIKGNLKRVGKLIKDDQ